MMGWIGLTLESTAIAAAAACLVSLGAWAWLRRADTTRTTSARRADLALLAGVLPMLTGLAVLVALILPSVLHAAGVQADHCALHDHHRHLCALHAATDPGGLALAGAGAMAWLATRAVSLGARQWQAVRSISALQRLGRWTEDARFPQVRVPGSPWLSLAVGIFSPRILISASLESRLDRSAFEAVIEHESAHLRRRDPQALAAITWAGLFAAPGVASLVRAAFLDAAEEASDAEAADRLGAPAVARALIAVARVQRVRPPAMSMGFGYTSVERRVRVLLDAPQVAARSHAPLLVLFALGTAAVLATAGSDWLHHAVESLIQ